MLVYDDEESMPSEKRQKLDDVSVLEDDSVSSDMELEHYVVGYDRPMPSWFWKLVGVPRIIESGYLGVPGDGVLGYPGNTDLVYPGDGVSNTAQRNFDKVPRCNKFEHGNEFGTLVYDLLSAVLMRNELYVADEDETIELCGKLHDVIESYEGHWPGYSFYYVKKENAVTIDLIKDKTVTLNISGPSSRPPCTFNDDLVLNFSLLLDDEDLFLNGFDRANNDLFGEGRLVTTKAIGTWLYRWHSSDHIFDTIIRRRVLNEWEPVAVAADIALYYNGVWASVRVKILKEGVNGFSGSIMARPCVFEYQIPLLAINPGEKVEIQSGGVITLRRSILAVPSYASLVVKAELRDQNDNAIVSGTAFFPACPRGSESKFIGIIQVDVEWDCDSPERRASFLPTEAECSFTERFF